MNDVIEFRSTVTAVVSGTEIPYAHKPGTYKGTKLTHVVNGREQEKTFADVMLAKNPGLAAQLSSLSAGDTIQITAKKSGNFTNFTSIEKVGETTTTKPAFLSSTKTAKKGLDAHVLGMIKGNTVTNAVALVASGKVGGNGPISESLKEAALHVLGLHSELESMDLEAILSGTKKETLEDI